MPPPDPTPKTPFDALTEPDQPTPERPHSEPGADEYVAQIKETADKLLRDRAARGDVKLLATAMRELRYCLKVFAGYRDRRKVTVFGSARTRPDHPAFKAAEEFGRRIVAEGWMVITGAGNGIMEAGHVGAGREHSFGLNIMLPFEQSANPVVHGDPKLMTLRYFFTRKLMFIKESEAIVLFPGGFGTHDEGFEALTLIQTGKSTRMPIILVHAPFWSGLLDWFKGTLIREGVIDKNDLELLSVVNTADEVLDVIFRYYAETGFEASEAEQEIKLNL